LKDFNDFKKYCQQFSNELSTKIAQVAKDELLKHRIIDEIAIATAIVKANTVLTFELLEKYHEWLHQ
jgi:hypothetical protein